MDKAMQKALSEDSNAFAYDELYTDMQASRQKQAQELSVDRQKRESKYISGLLKTADDRKRENEVLYERKLLKERQEEDDQFGDKPKYVTGAYKAKLLEQQQWLEEQKAIETREAAEAIGARGDRAFNSFYSNLIERESSHRDPKPAAAAPIVPPAADSKKRPHADISDAAPLQSESKRPSLPAVAPSEPVSSAARPTSEPATVRPSVAETSSAVSPPAAAVAAPAPVPVVDKEAKVLSARERYLQRKAQTEAASS
jgi:coiled-coil domain-containing protein 55